MTQHAQSELVLLQYEAIPFLLTFGIHTELVHYNQNLSLENYLQTDKLYQ